MVQGRPVETIIKSRKISDDEIKRNRTDILD
jgi:hypothetical protein